MITKGVIFLFIGIDIGGTKCAVIKGAVGAAPEKRIEIPTGALKATFEKIVCEIDVLGEFDAIGISCGGPLDEKRGVILSPPNLPGWDDFFIVDSLKARYGVPVALCNDANACALAEWQHGAGKGTENMVFLTFGTGLGAGLILNGKLYRGTRGMAGEVGHIRLSEFGPSGYGKVGSFEGFCSGAGLFELGRAYAKKYIQNAKEPSFIKGKDINSFTVKDMACAARNGDECALEVFSVCSEMLGRGLAVISDILDPDIIVIGSIFARCRDLLESRALETMKKEALGAGCRIDAPFFGESIGDMAALTVAELAKKEAL